VTAAGGVGGLLLGFGFVFLFATPVTSVNKGVARSVHTVEANSNPRVATIRTATESFGMFRGKTLQEAIRNIQERTFSQV
jgi:hypothetical protein